MNNRQSENYREYIYMGVGPMKVWNVVYYESTKRELKTRPIYECRFDERLKTETEESTLLVV